jgi:hypothetical protein
MKTKVIKTNLVPYDLETFFILIIAISLLIFLWIECINKAQVTIIMAVTRWLYQIK